MKINNSSKLVIIQEILQTLNTKFQNTKISTTSYSNSIVVIFYHVYNLSFRGHVVIRVFKYIYNHLQPPGAATFHRGERNY